MAEIFVSLILFQIMFSNFTMGFNPTPYWGAEMAIVGLVSLSVASLIFFVRIALPGKAGKIGYGIIMGATTVLFAAQEVYYALFGTFFTVYSMINSAQITEFMDVIFIRGGMRRQISCRILRDICWWWHLMRGLCLRSSG